MAGRNPFSDRLPDGFPGNRSAEECSTADVLCHMGEAVWDYLDTLPGKAEATLAKRKLQEAVFWGEQADVPAASLRRQEGDC